MKPEVAHRVAARIKRTPKMNRKFRVSGVLISKGKAHVQVVSKKTGRPYNL